MFVFIYDDSSLLEVIESDNARTAWGAAETKVRQLGRDLNRAERVFWNKVSDHAVVQCGVYRASSDCSYYRHRR